MQGCVDWLSITPESELILEEFWQTESQALSELGACYKAFTYDEVSFRLIYWTEVRSDNTVPFDTNDREIYDLSEGDITSHNGITSWTGLYRVINYCNIFLHFSGQAQQIDQNFSEAKLYSMQAEARSMRALAYFYLVRVFKDVPYITEPSLSDSQDYAVKKAPGDSIIGVIIDDLEYSLRFAPSAHSSVADTKGRITKNAIRAILADVYLWNEQYEDAVRYCDEIIDSKDYTLLDGENVQYSAFYAGNSVESIFELQFGEAENDMQFNNAVHNLYGANDDYLAVLQGAPNLAVGSTDSPFESNYGDEQEEDLRYKDFMWNDENSDMHVIFKYSGIIRTENNNTSSYTFRRNSANWIVYRYSDILLMKAEALIQLNRSTTDLQDAMKLINTTYLRSNPQVGSDSLQLSSFSDIPTLEELLLRERQREFLFEGKRWFDLLRAARRADDPKILIGKVSAKYSGNGNLLFLKATNMNALYLPIYYRDIEANSNLEQNEYYQLLETEGE